MHIIVHSLLWIILDVEYCKSPSYESNCMYIIVYIYSLLWITKNSIYYARKQKINTIFKRFGVEIVENLNETEPFLLRYSIYFRNKFA